MPHKYVPNTIKDGFQVMPSDNGGWVLTFRGDDAGMRMDIKAAFTNSVDLLEYLVNELGVVPRN